MSGRPGRLVPGTLDLRGHEHRNARAQPEPQRAEREAPKRRRREDNVRRRQSGRGEYHVGGGPRCGARHDAQLRRELPPPVEPGDPEPPVPEWLPLPVWLLLDEPPPIDEPEPVEPVDPVPNDDDPLP
jgi:hypothetical protein